MSNKSQRIINAMPLNNVYESLDVDFRRESSKEHDDKSTLKERETQRNTNLKYSHASYIITNI